MRISDWSSDVCSSDLEVIAAAEAKGMLMLDAPVSGGVAGAENAALTFMVGGSDAAFARAKPVLEAMGKNIVHAGGAGNGQVAKVRSEARRVGKESVSTGRTRWSPEP